ncbi:MAG: hypothetical protein MSG64_00305 [Pyrinomonadaceae bacterium MAG19_C2-C3]|nr:hypothetical protein [Pyrinomonadaceae bacterium MAG19_C2-C3]
MTQAARLFEILKTYRQHAWRVRRVLLTAATRAELSATPGVWRDELSGATVHEAEFDAVWFARAAGNSSGDDGVREAWELRLIAAMPFALFEMFEADEAEEDREDVRGEMEAQMRERLAPPAADDALDRSVR